MAELNDEPGEDGVVVDKGDDSDGADFDFVSLLFAIEHIL